MKLLEKKAETTYVIELTDAEMDVIVDVIGRSNLDDYFHSTGHKMQSRMEYYELFNNLKRIL